MSMFSGSSIGTKRRLFKTIYPHQMLGQSNVLTEFSEANECDQIQPQRTGVYLVKWILPWIATVKLMTGLEYAYEIHPWHENLRL